ncbi:bifunctional 4-hydroxy-2-oxoglutarate aldolase/2-dehydro-3-deoxy-phosphogluconate aldolase [Streptomyces orinoci]|uniref:Bifunctional 4-hydroxy-2-oxoglutarate aldolase/2-dehydro-3-deoxy-phosphogluconate aldolase n=1 Tax=Streptomyces orinoci TaxID=67339 RepID=A0ABV3JZF4_STRON|nr:bifunctional 4-hydroxy-2-oxoglutarate aldolase/2-dehydro-3-deoxy-phosphogluconate aldolase [Streptomyces orinoci]
MYRWEITRAALAQRVLAVVHGESYDQAAEIAGTLVSAGITSVEIALTTPFALEAVATLSREVGDEALIGAGTVLDGHSARMAVEAGARFLASPSLDAEVLRTGHRYGVPVFPGAGTPTEILRALELGADAVKLFPASSHRPGGLREIHAELPQAAMVPSGDIEVDSAPEWIAAGAAAIGLGASLSEGDRDSVTKRVGELLTRLEAAAG